MPYRPLPISAVNLLLDQSEGQPEYFQYTKLASRYLPLDNSAHRYARFSDALGALDRPRLYSNRLSYRLLECGLREFPPRMSFSLCRYFEMIDIGEILALEFASGRSRIRESLGTPFDLRRRLTSPSINTITLRLEPHGNATYFMHLRDSRDVALASGQTHVIPCGGFQPSGVSRFAIESDFNLWHNVVREYAEEFLGLEEANSDIGDPIDFRALKPYASLIDGETSGRIRPWIFGVAIDGSSKLAGFEVSSGFSGGGAAGA